MDVRGLLALRDGIVTLLDEQGHRLIGAGIRADGERADVQFATKDGREYVLVIQRIPHTAMQEALS